MNLEISKSGYQWTVITSNLSAFLASIALIWLAYQLGIENDTYFFNWIICLFGAILGWGVGLLVSPSSKTEKEQFSGLTKTISAFLSGYILSKLDRVIENLLESDKIFQELFLIKIALFLTAFFITVIIVFINRRYFLNVMKYKEQSSNDDP